MKKILIGLAVLLLVGGCAGKRHYSSSLMDYLYPAIQQTMTPSLPVLSLPLKVGIAFVPDHSASGYDPFSTWKAHHGQYSSISEKERMELMETVAKEFKQHDFIESIELIPSGYLTQRGGFDNLQQVRTMYGLDVIALLSYDQVQNIDEGLLSLSYWTIVGAYVVKGQKNSTNTLMDAAVLHIPSKTLLFRAPGTSFVAGKATPVNLDEQLRLDAAEGFQLATSDMIGNLKLQLDLFRQKVKEQPDKYQVVSKPGSSYGAGISSSFALLLLLSGAVAWLVQWRQER